MKIVAKALITDANNQYLVLVRSKTHPHFALHYDFPGGVVEKNEDIASAVAREIMEEIGIEVKVSNLQLAFEYNVTDDLLHVLFTLGLRSASPTITLSWEHCDYKWVGAEALLNEPIPNNVDAYYIDVINWLKS